MKTTTPNPTLAAFDSEGSGVGTYDEVIGADWSGPGADGVAVCGHLRTRPAA
jgi:hypothetical protein